MQWFMKKKQVDTNCNITLNLKNKKKDVVKVKN